MGIFEIRNKAEREVLADTMEISVTFNATGTSADRVSKHVMDDTERFLGEIEGLGIQIKQASLNADRVFDYSYNDDDSVYAKRTLMIRTPFNMGLSNKIRELLNDGGYSFLFSVNQSISNKAEIRAELMKEALTNSKKMAQELAESMGMRVDSIDSMKEESQDLYLHCEQERGIASVGSASSYQKSDKLGAQIVKEKVELTVKWKIV